MGAKLDIPTADFWYVRDGKIQEFNCPIGTSAMFAQLGVLPDFTSAVGVRARTITPTGNLRQRRHLLPHRASRRGRLIDRPARLAPVDRHRGKTGRGESQRRRAAGRTAATGADRNCRARTISLGFPVQPLTAARSVSLRRERCDRPRVCRIARIQ